MPAPTMNDLAMLKQTIMAKLLRARQTGAEEISKRLPEAVMPREAVEKKRAQLGRWDAQTKE